jgi:hypothetical protein
VAFGDRKAGLKRTGPPATKVETVRKFLDRGRRRSAETLQAGKAVPTRAAAPKAKRKPRLTQLEIELALKFFDAGMAQGCCQNCGHTGPRDHFEVHHGLPKAIIRDRLRAKGKPCPPEAIWDPRNALLACSELAPNRCHPRHTTRVKPMRRSALRPETWAFARSLGAWAIDRLYLDYPDDQEDNDA